MEGVLSLTAWLVTRDEAEEMDERRLPLVLTWAGAMLARRLVDVFEAVDGVLDAASSLP